MSVTNLSRYVTSANKRKLSDLSKLGEIYSQKSRITLMENLFSSSSQVILHYQLRQ